MRKFTVCKTDENLEYQLRELFIRSGLSTVEVWEFDSFYEYRDYYDYGRSNITVSKPTIIRYPKDHETGGYYDENIETNIIKRLTFMYIKEIEAVFKDDKPIIYTEEIKDTLFKFVSMGVSVAQATGPAIGMDNEILLLSQMELEQRKFYKDLFVKLYHLYPFYSIGIDFEEKDIFEISTYNQTMFDEYMYFYYDISFFDKRQFELSKFVLNRFAFVQNNTTFNIRPITEYRSSYNNRSNRTCINTKNLDILIDSLFSLPISSEILYNHIKEKIDKYKDGE